LQSIIYNPLYLCVVFWCGRLCVLYSNVSDPAHCDANLQDVSFTIASDKKRGEKATLLQGVSGFFEPGKMSALVCYGEGVA